MKAQNISLLLAKFQKNFMSMKGIIICTKKFENSLDLLEFELRVSENDYKALSCYFYGVWRIRNLCKHNEVSDNYLSNCKSIFNKRFITVFLLFL